MSMTVCHMLWGRFCKWALGEDCTLKELVNGKLHGSKGAIAVIFHLLCRLPFKTAMTHLCSRTAAGPKGPLGMFSSNRLLLTLKQLSINVFPVGAVRCNILLLSIGKLKYLGVDPLEVASHWTNCVSVMPHHVVLADCTEVPVGIESLHGIHELLCIAHLQSCCVH
jgi:hypothetical protein